MAPRRFPRTARPYRPRAKRALEPARELRHAEHSLHQLERLFEHFVPAGISIPSLIGAFEHLGPSGGGPLVITIGSTVALEDLEEVSDEKMGELEADIHEIMENTVINTVSEARSLVPVRTGRLRDSISGEADDEALMITFKADTGYAIYVEDGTSKMAPSPYLRQPAAEAEDDMNTSIEDAIADNLDDNVQGDDDSNGVDLEIETAVELVTTE